MNEKEFNGLILAELVKIANDVFTNEIEIAPGTYTAAELAKLKDANGNEINIKYLCVDAKLNITDFRTVQINRFKCSFPVDQVFNLVWQFEKLIGTKQANKTRFTKIEERENIVCSFDMWITKEHLNITKLVTLPACVPQSFKRRIYKDSEKRIKSGRRFCKRNSQTKQKSGFSLRTIAGDNKVYLSYNDADSNGHKELCATLEKAALIDIKLGFFASNVIPLLSGWTGGV